MNEALLCRGSECILLAFLPGEKTATQSGGVPKMCIYFWRNWCKQTSMEGCVGTACNLQNTYQRTVVLISLWVATCHLSAWCSHVMCRNGITAARRPPISNSNPFIKLFHICSVKLYSKQQTMFKSQWNSTTGPVHKYKTLVTFQRFKGHVRIKAALMSWSSFRPKSLFHKKIY